MHMLEWPAVDAAWAQPALGEKWAAVRSVRQAVTEAIEPFRRDKLVRSSLEAEVCVANTGGLESAEFCEICIVASVTTGACDAISVAPTSLHKCGRCWRHLPEVSDDGALCGRCAEVVA